MSEDTPGTILMQIPMCGKKKKNWGVLLFMLVNLIFLNHYLQLGLNNMYKNYFLVKLFSRKANSDLSKVTTVTPFFVFNVVKKW